MIRQPGPPPTPAHQLTVMSAGRDTTAKCGSCRCGEWTVTALTSDYIAGAFQRHVRSAQAVLL